MLIFIQENIKGILGTIIIHLVVYLVLTGLRIKQFHDFTEETMIVLDFSESVAEVKKIEVNIEDALPDKWQKNAAQNVSREFTEKISTEAYEKQLMEELGMTNEDFEIPDENATAIQNQKKNTEEKDDEKSEESGKIFNPESETNTKFEIDRDVIYPEYPQYKCKGNGRVLMEIFVNQKGIVVQVKVLENNSSEPCVAQEAVAAAYNARFNTDFNAPTKQRGTLMYRFVAQ